MSLRAYTHIDSRTSARSATDEDTLFGIAIDAGAEDVRSDDENYEVVTQPEDFANVRQAFDPASGRILDAVHVGRADKFLDELIWMSRVLRHGRQHVRLGEAPKEG